jgi:hypothetical protein
MMLRICRGSDRPPSYPRGFADKRTLTDAVLLRGDGRRGCITQQSETQVCARGERP